MYMKEKVINIIKNNDLLVPKLLLSNYKKLKLTSDELILLIYIINDRDVTFNPKKISTELELNLEEVMNLFESLITKDILKLDNKKIDGIITENINLDELYIKLSHLVISESEEEQPSTIYDKFEEKFGRTLSPMEYAIIGGWQDLNYSDELILMALDEAVYNGVYKLNYIDKILFEWNKKGIKSREDKIKNDTEFKNRKSEKKELLDYNWLEDE